MGNPNSVAEEIQWLSKLAGIECFKWKHKIIARAVLDPIVVVPKKVNGFQVPENFTWVVTYIECRTFPLPVLNDPTQGVGDFRSELFDENGQTTAYLTDNGVKMMASIPTTGFFNRPVLFAFSQKHNIEFWILRGLASLPGSLWVHTVINGYLTVGKAQDCLAHYLTDIQQGEA